MKKINSLYIHFPFCRHLCNYCDFFKNVPKDAGEIEKYHTLLENSYERHKTLIEEHGYIMSDLKTLYIGGGTPSLWREEGADFFNSFLKKRNISLSSDGEFTMECNPGSYAIDSYLAWKEIGINRFSVGVQSLDQRFLKELDRIHDVESVHNFLEVLSKNNENFSVDLMLGLPFSKEYKRDIINELEELLKYDPNHFSLYILTTKDNYIHKDNLPDEEFIEEEYLKVAEYLKSKGYIHYEVSNFSKPNFESEHNLAYWKSESVAALGPSATGFLAEEKLRFKWKNLSEEFETEKLSHEQFEIESIYMRLRTNRGVDFSKKSHYFDALKNWERRGLATTENGITIVNSMGYLVLDSLMNDLFIADQSL